MPRPNTPHHHHHHPPRPGPTLMYMVNGNPMARGQKVTAPTSPTTALKKGCSHGSRCGKSALVQAGR